jgi:hypothetical protein
LETSKAKAFATKTTSTTSKSSWDPKLESANVVKQEIYTIFV